MDNSISPNMTNFVYAALQFQALLSLSSTSCVLKETVHCRHSHCSCNNATCSRQECMGYMLRLYTGESKQIYILASITAYDLSWCLCDIENGTEDYLWLIHLNKSCPTLIKIVADSIALLKIVYAYSPDGQNNVLTWWAKRCAQKSGLWWLAKLPLLQLLRLPIWSLSLPKPKV